MNHTIDDQVLAIGIPTDLLSTTVESLRAEILPLFDDTALKYSQVGKVHLNLCAVNMIDSAGVNFLVGIIRACQTRKLGITVTVKSRFVHRTLLFLRIDRHVELVVAS
ncbi:MAG: STAS domain-containing protein [Verrucomicrobiales bacterium]|nr:STAS domain-containing protein [Verrucomicrobiales bacterium]